MTVAFPAIHPTGCAFTPPEWSITESRSQSGVRSYRIWASVPSDALLDLEFENITEQQAFAVLQAHAEAKGAIESLSLPPILFSGVQDQAFAGLFAQEGSGLSWHFVNGDPPVIERVPGRRYSTRVRLRAELRFS